MNIRKYIDEFFLTKSGIAAIYLFGSVVRVGLEAAKDVDVAVLYSGDSVPDEFQRIQEQQNLAAGLGKDVDLIVLNKAPVILRMQILKKGSLIILKNRKICNAFVVRTINEYFDLKRIRTPVEQKLVEFPILGRS